TPPFERPAPRGGLDGAITAPPPEPPSPPVAPPSPTPATDEAGFRLEREFERAYESLAHDPLLTRRRWQQHLWALLSVIALVAFLPALWGAGAHSDSEWHRLRAALHVFSSGFPDADQQTGSNWLTFAEYLAPLLFLSATLAIVARVYQRQWTWFLARR